jgi:glucosamine--fructose-6-phosphate aminotransferase (isomerizing)
VLVAGEGGGDQHPWIDDVLTTVSQEQSAAYTISYTSALAALASLAARIGAHRTGAETLAPAVLSRDVPDALAEALQTEATTASIAEQTKDRRRIWIVGGGPSAITAPETALKIKEAAYLMAEGLSTEQMFHGPFQCASQDDLFILIAPSGPAQERTLQLAGPVKEIGGEYVVVSDGTAGSATNHALATIDVPPVPEVFTTLSCLLPMQLLTYHYALACGTNPDSFHLDDERFMRAYRMNTL